MVTKYYNVSMSITKYNSPITFRPDDDDLQAIEKIKAAYIRPGLRMSQAQIIKVALAETASKLPEVPQPESPFSRAV